jgi:6-pyruvoyltetrahydropterin/6-carboxytetrahydropterin synthase
MDNEKFILTVTAEFDAAHSLRSSKSICEKLHGHRWKLEAAFTGSLKPDGIVLDFLELEKEVKRRIINKLDHTNLNDMFEKPTTELICRWIWERLEELGLVELRLWETPNFSVIYKR